ncbi:hypothetical protein H0H92_011655 [Tricholoma furcatifolium]|nr:hypothetical protein H0H92_011655 [Tricholoma furcatifolium]
MLISAWLRYAGTVKTLSVQHSYALIILGQFFSAIAQPVYQVLGPKYSETWFDLKGRTTATMIVAIVFSQDTANPVGGAIGQLISPLVGSTRHSILVLGILSTAVIPFVFCVGSAPPVPPIADAHIPLAYSGSKPSPSLMSFLYAMLGLKTSDDAKMTMRERFDFAIVIFIFGALAGIVAAIATAPLFDRVFTHHLAITAKILVPIVGAAYLSLIWAAKPHNLGGLFAIMTIIGLKWFETVEGALRADADANPPLNMRRALIFNGAIIVTSAVSVILLRGRQARKERDEAEAARTP